jgi:hypothetical protein
LKGVDQILKAKALVVLQHAEDSFLVFFRKDPSGDFFRKARWPTAASET